MQQRYLQGKGNSWGTNTCLCKPCSITARLSANKPVNRHSFLDGREREGDIFESSLSKKTGVVRKTYMIHENTNRMRQYFDKWHWCYWSVHLEIFQDVQKEHKGNLMWDCLIKKMNQKGTPLLMDRRERKKYFLPLVCFSVDESSQHLPFFCAREPGIWTRTTKLFLCICTFYQTSIQTILF